TGNTSRLFELVARLLASHPGWKGPAILALGVVLLPALTWKYLTGGVAPVITGRRWLEGATSFLFAGVLMSLSAAGLWLAQHRDYLPRLIPVIPWLVVCAAVSK